MFVKKIGDMKKWLLLVFVCALGSAASAQYNGGNGDGFAHATGAATITSAQDVAAAAPAFRLSSNLVRPGQEMQLLGQPNVAGWVLYSTSGAEISKGEGPLLKAPNAAGSFMLRVQAQGGQHQTMRFTVAN